jgi:hypothetical protein
MPAEWLSKQFPDQATRDHYRSVHELGEVPEDLERFEDYCAARRERIRGKLLDLLSAGTAAALNAPLAP